MNEREIFAAALGKPAGDERRALLDQVCSGDVDLRNSVEALLAAHEQADDFLASKSGVFARTVVPERISEAPGTVIGPYRLLEQIGEGGFGVVFMAEQSQPVRRKVALKVIKPGMDTRQVIARFEAERQALALMDHPHIAKVYDAGTTESGRPYFVMELVRGIPITEFCDQHQLTVRERLELFVTVCQAAQHAHQKGIIHRDIKPTNVLVTLHDDRPVVKVIDFGVAKATSGQLTDKTLFTGFMQMLGTPLYMSPEQTALSGVDVDTRSDIYSLGVLLYELLTGSTPFDRQRFTDAAVDEVRRIIREEEPKKPSTRLTTLHDSLPTLAAQRKIEPRKLSQLLEGDIDWIVMKALEKDRTRRYETANGFARDVQRYLSDEVIEARPPSAGYRLRKAIRRNKVALTTVGLVAIALIVGTGVSTWQAVRATRAEHRVREALGEVRTERDRAVNAERRAQQSLDDETAARIEAQQNLAHARGAVEEFFTLVSQNKLFDEPSLQPLRKDLLEAAVRYYEAILEQRHDDPALLADLAIAQLRIAPVYRDFDRNDDLIDALAAGLENIDRLRRDFPDARGEQLRLAGFWKPLRGRTKTEMPKNPEKVDRTFQKLVDLWEMLHQEHPTAIGFESDLAAAYFALANWRMEFGTAINDGPMCQLGFDAADKSIALWERLCAQHPDVPDYHDSLIETLFDTAFWLRTTGQAEKGKMRDDRARALRRVVVVRFPHVPQFRQFQIDMIRSDAKALETAGRFAEANDLYQQQYDLAKKLSADFSGTPKYAELVCDAGNNLIRMSPHIGRAESEIEPIRYEMAAQFARLQRLGSEVLASTDEQWLYAETLNLMGNTFMLSGDRTTAASAFRQCIEMGRKLAVEFPGERKYRMRVVHASEMLAGLVGEDERSAVIEELDQLLLQLHNEDPDNIDYFHELIDSRGKLAWELHANGRHQQSIELLDKTIAACERALAAHPDNQQLRNEIALFNNNGAWWQVSQPGGADDNVEWAVRIAQQAVELVPDSWSYWNTLYVAQYRAGDWEAAEQTIRKATDFNGGGNAHDWFFLAMVDGQRGEQGRARHWFDAASLWMAKYAATDGDLIHFRGEAMNLMGIEDEPLPTEVDVAAIGRALSAADPDLDCYWVITGRAETYIRAFEWEEAKPDFVRAAELRPDADEVQYQLATLLARVGDEPAYREHCRKLLARHAETTDPMWAERTAKACLLLPVTGEDLDAACRLAEKAVTLDEQHWVIPFAQVAAAMAAYRRGEFRACLDWAEKALTKEGEQLWFRNSQAYFLRALALASLGERDAADTAFAKAAGILTGAQHAAKERPTVDAAWHDFAICELLQQEAEQLLKESAVTGGNEVAETAEDPGDGGE